MTPFDPNLPPHSDPRYCAQCGERAWAFCAGLDEDSVTALRRVVARQVADAGQTLYREGDPAGDLYTVTAGCVKLYKLLADGRRQVTAFLYPGDVFGLVRDGRQTATAEAVTAANLCRFSRTGLDALFRDQPAVRERLFGLLLSELGEAQEQMLLLGRKTAREKLATFLLGQVRRAESLCGQDGPLVLPMGRADIADHLGLTIETVSRTLTALQREGLVSLGRAGRVTVLDDAPLHEAASGG